MENFLSALKTFLTTFLLRWVLKIGGTFLATIGLQSDKVEEIIGGIVAVVIGMLVSWISNKKALAADPPLK